jgi:hypothetical protein
VELLQGIQKNTRQLALVREMKQLRLGGPDDIDRVEDTARIKESVRHSGGVNVGARDGAAILLFRADRSSAYSRLGSPFAATEPLGVMGGSAAENVTLHRPVPHADSLVHRMEGFRGVLSRSETYRLRWRGPSGRRPSVSGSASTRR